MAHGWAYFWISWDGRGKVWDTKDSGDKLRKMNYEEGMDSFGRDGWELVSVIQEGFVSTFYFKRPLQ